jgi:hypothetical protein
MADTRYAPLKVTRAGLTAVYITAVIAATTNYVMKNDGRTFFRFYKTGANPCTVTFISQEYIRGLAVASPTLSVPATSGDVFAGPFEPTIFNDGNGDMRFNFSEVTAMFFAGVSM